MRFRCRFGWHPWPKWGAPEQGTVHNSGHRWTITIQQKTCPGCAQVKIREVKAYP